LVAPVAQKWHAVVGLSLQLTAAAGATVAAGVAVAAKTRSLIRHAPRLARLRSR